MSENIYGLSSETLKAIGEFTVNWSQYEYMYYGNNASGKEILKKRDETTNLPVVKDAVIRELSRFQKELGNFFVSREKEINRENIENYFFNDISHGSSEIAAVLDFIQNNTEENPKLTEGLVCICRIRNNLMHGEKDASKLDEQKNMILHASNILYMICNFRIRELN